MIRRMTFLLAIISLFALVSCSGSKAKTDTKIIKVAFNQSEAHPQYKALAEMGEKLKTQTKGRYELEIHPNELLGDQRAAVELVQTGAIQMTTVANPLVENYNKDFAVMGLPYIYDSIAHQEEVYTSNILDELFATTRANGFEVLTAFTAGARSIYTTKEVRTPADLKGLKIRVIQSDTMMKMINQMGGIGTPMSHGEVYTAIQQKVIDGAENNEITYSDSKHYEVAPIFSYTTHLMIPDYLIINADFLDSMSEEDKKIFDTLIKETTEREFALWNESIEPAKQRAIEGGAKFIEIDIKPFQASVQPLINSVTSSSDMAKKVYTSIRELAK